MKIIAISDVHNKLSKIALPDGDLLIIAGDLTNLGKMEELIKFNDDVGLIKDKYKHGVLVIAGNHDFLLEEDYALAKSLIPNVAHYLQESMVEIAGVKFFGSPTTPFYHGWAFNEERGPDIDEKWDLIPNGIDVLITHGPAAGVHDVSSRGERMGCEDLMRAILRVKPKLHVCGHNHAGFGIKSFMGTTYINASSSNEKYMITNPPIVIELDDASHEVLDVYFNEPVKTEE